MKERPKNRIGALVKGWTCPCGCGLQLDRFQVSDEQRLNVLLGPPTGRYVNLKSTIAHVRTRTEPPEPTTKGTCRSCGAQMAIFTYLANSLALRGAPWPFCDGCMQRQERAA